MTTLKTEDSTPWIPGEPEDRTREYEARSDDRPGLVHLLRYTDGAWHSFTATTDTELRNGWRRRWEHRPLPAGCHWWNTDSGWVYAPRAPGSEASPPDAMAKTDADLLDFLKTSSRAGSWSGLVCDRVLRAPIDDFVTIMDNHCYRARISKDEIRERATNGTLIGINLTQGAEFQDGTAPTYDVIVVPGAAIVADGKMLGRFQARDLIAEAFGVKPEGTLAEVVALVAPKADAPARWKIGDDRIQLVVGGSVGRLTLDRKTTAEVIADLAVPDGWMNCPRGSDCYEREDGARLWRVSALSTGNPGRTTGWWYCVHNGAETPAFEDPLDAIAEMDGAEPAHQHEGVCEPTRCEFHDPTCPVRRKRSYSYTISGPDEPATQGWGIPARWYGEHGVRSGLLERDGGEWVFSAAPDTREAGASTPMVEVLRLRCSPTADDIAVRDFPDASEHDNARILIDPDGTLAVVDRYGDWGQHREGSPADPALAGWSKVKPDDVPAWPHEAYRRGDLVVMLCPSTLDVGRWGAGLYSEKPEEDGDPWPLRFGGSGSKEDAMRAAHEGEEAHPWGHSSVHPGWSDDTRADELRKGVMALCGFDAHEIADTKHGDEALMECLADRIRDSQAKALHFSRELDRVQRDLAHAEHDPIRARVLLAYLGKFRHWARKIVGDDGSMSDDELRACLDTRAEASRMAGLYLGHWHELAEHICGPVPAPPPPTRVSRDAQLRTALNLWHEDFERDFTATGKALSDARRFRQWARALSGLDTEASDDELRTALLDDLRPPSGELLSRVEARLLALLPEEIEPLTDSAASLVRLYFEMHAALSGGGR